MYLLLYKSISNESQSDHIMEARKFSFNDVLTYIHCRFKNFGSVAMKLAQDYGEKAYDYLIISN